MSTLFFYMYTLETIISQYDAVIYLHIVPIDDFTTDQALLDHLPPPPLPQ